MAYVSALFSAQFVAGLVSAIVVLLAKEWILDKFNASRRRRKQQEDDIEEIIDVAVCVKELAVSVWAKNPAHDYDPRDYAEIIGQLDFVVDMTGEVFLPQIVPDAVSTALYEFRQTVVGDDFDSRERLANSGRA